MSTSRPRTTRLTAVAAIACGAMALSACGSSSSKTAAPSSTSTTMSSSASPSAGASSSSSTSPLPASRSSSTVALDPVKACQTAVGDTNTAITSWNNAVSTQNSKQLKAAANNFRTTATNLGKLPAQSGDAGFKARIGPVATDLNAMATAYFKNQTVSVTQYNTDSGNLRSYCQKLIDK
ncbi:hypothetical protein [Rudaeicoccus suwonensis]|uniref:Uncharacterized protein n=1 Tax=Rudaeicoccus suwonensis TaxID=657409 RepID=A0A561E3H1_9MICO|nr:hypothetical protein [Rudaeicoccus suwonensis]TWE10149.1 hypothetical protein BKA23_2501 [Rudaeicoccus suwonensis]